MYSSMQEHLKNELDLIKDQGLFKEERNNSIFSGSRDSIRFRSKGIKFLR